MITHAQHPWPIVRLGEVLAPVERAEKVNPTASYRLLGVRLDGNGAFLRETVTGTQTSAPTLYRVEPDDFIFSRLFACRGAFAVIGPELAGCHVSGEFPTFRPKLNAEGQPGIDVRYLRYWFTLPVIIATVNEQCTGSTPLTRNRFKEDKFLALEIPLPPLAEQRRLVTRLDDLASRIAHARKLRDEAEEETAVVISRTLGQLIDGQGFPRVQLGGLLKELPRNGMSPKGESDSGTRLMLRINAVSSSPSRFVDTSGTKRVDFEDSEARPFLLQHNDVFIVRYNGDINRVAKPAIFKSATQAPSAIAYPDKLMRLRANEGLMDPDYLVYALSAPSVRAQVDELGKTTAGNIGINAGNVKAFQIPHPPPAEQRRIVAELDALQAKVDALKSHQAATAASLDALLPALLDRAFKGEL